MIMYHSGTRATSIDDSVRALIPEEELTLDGTMLVLRGRARLVTYADVVRNLLDPTAIPVLKRVHKRLCLDSGGFTMAQGGEPVTIEEYSAFLKEWEGYFDFVANLDVIGGTDSHVLSSENQRALEELGHEPTPIYHYGEPFEVLEELVRSYNYIGLGGLVRPGLAKVKKLNWLTRCFSIVNDQSQIHGYGVSDLEMVKQFPWYSVDSSTWLSGTRFGEWPPFHTGIYSAAVRLAPWVEYLDAVAESAGEHYEHLEAQDDQGHLFGPIKLDKKRELGDCLKNAGPVELTWPRRLPLQWPGPRVSVLLVAQAPSAGSNPEEPLSSESGKRLAEIMGMSFPEFLDRVPRTNLIHQLADDGSDLLARHQQAKERAAEIVQRCSEVGVRVIALGHGAGSAFGLGSDNTWFDWVSVDGAKVAQAPHPSGNADWWADTVNRELATSFFASLATIVNNEEETE